MKTIIPIATVFAIMMSGPLMAQTLWVPSGTVGTSTNGNVGIGTSTPGAALDVVGSANVRGGIFATTNSGAGAVTEMIKLASGGGANTAGTASRIAGYTDVISGYIDFKRFVSGGPTTGIVLGTFAGDALTIRSSGSNNPGYVGIGTSDPKVKLDMRGTSATPSATLQIVGDSVSTLLLGQDADGGVIRGQGGSNSLKFLVGGSADQAASGSGSEAMRINTSGNVGIGTASPVAKLQAVSSDAVYVGLFAGTSKAARVQTTTNGVIIAGTDQTGVTSYQPLFIDGSMVGFSVQGGEKMRVDANGNVGIGTQTPSQKLSVNGTIRAKEVIVDTGWSDYVFAPDYKLAPLSEVETHIKENGHLPGIPSAKEVAEHGVSMGEMQAKLLAKIEELTLHQIEQEKKMQAQENRLNAQAGQLEQLRQENQSLRERLP